jgi:hypothetical protein
MQPFGRFLAPIKSEGANFIYMGLMSWLGLDERGSSWRRLCAQYFGQMKE